MVFKINKFFKNLMSTGFSNILSQLLTFAVGTYYAGVLGGSDFGILTLIQSILMYFTMITLYGMQVYGTREISKDADNIDILTSQVIFFRLIIALICFIALTTFSFVAGKGVLFRDLLIVYGLTLFPLAFNLDWVYNGLQKMHYTAYYNIIKAAIPFAIILIFLKDSDDILLIPIAMVISLVFAAFYHMFIYKHKFKRKIVITKFDFKKLLICGSPFLVSSLLNMVNNYIDRIIIGFTRTDFETGIYSSAYFIIMFLINFIAIIFTPIFPLLINYYHSRMEKELTKLLQNISKYILLIAMPLSVGGILLSKEIILLLFGEEFITAYIPLRILLVYVFLLFLREIFAYQLNAWDKEKIYLKIVAISAVTNLVLNIIFTPKYGMVAAAYITLFSEVINFVLMRKYAISVFKTKLFANTLKTTIPCAIMGIFIVLLKLAHFNVIISILLAIVVYGVSVIMLKLVNINEILSGVRSKLR